MLQARLDLEGATVIDLFAGTGAMGIEALSRGASNATFVERSKAACVAIEANLGQFGWAPGHEVVQDANGVFEARLQRAEACRWLQAGSSSPASSCFTVAFCDPPYRFSSWPALMRLVRAEFLLAESPTELEAGLGWEMLKVRRHGGAFLSLARRVEGQD